VIVVYNEYLEGLITGIKTTKRKKIQTLLFCWAWWSAGQNMLADRL
jgi:hypothetical protein